MLRYWREKMRMSLLRWFLLLATTAAFSAPARAESCDKTFLERLEGDKTLTTVQRQRKADDQCVGKVIAAVGNVNDVSSSSNIDLVGADGLRYDLYLSPAHKCGDVIAIQKGQRISAQGRVYKVYITRREYVLREAVCVK